MSNYVCAKCGKPTAGKQLVKTYSKGQKDKLSWICKSCKDIEKKESQEKTKKLLEEAKKNDELAKQQSMEVIKRIEEYEFQKFGIVR
jgi:RNase P subunit RPR2